MSEKKTHPTNVPVYAIECHCSGMGLRYFSLFKLFGELDFTFNKYLKDAIFYLDHDLKNVHRFMRRNMKHLEIESYDIIQVR